MEVHELAEKLEEFQIEMSRDLYEYHNGLRASSKVLEIYKEYSEVLNITKIKTIIKYSKTHPEKSEYQRLAYALVREYLIFFIHYYQLKVDYNKTKASYKLNGDNISLNELHLSAINEKDREKRSLLFELLDKLNNEEVNPLLIEMYAELERIALDLGFQNYISLCNEINGIDSDSLISEIEMITRETEVVFRCRMEKVFKRELKMKIENARRSDLVEIWGLRNYAGSFSDQSPMNILTNVIKALGFEEQFTRIRIENRKIGMTSRSFCYPIKIPDEIVLVYAKRERPDDYRILFHEMGHSLHLSNIPEQIPIWQRCWFEPSLSEAYALLFENLIFNSNFLRQYFQLIDSEFIETCMFYQIFQYRFTAAKVIWEQKYTSNLEISASINYWTLLLKKYTGFIFPSSNAYSSREFLTYSVNYLVAYKLESQLRHYLENQYGKSWFNSRDAGDFLKKIWSSVEIKSAKDLSNYLGFKSLDGKCLMNDFIKVYKGV